VLYVEEIRTKMRIYKAGKQMPSGQVQSGASILPGFPLAKTPTSETHPVSDLDTIVTQIESDKIETAEGQIERGIALEKSGCGASSKQEDFGARIVPSIVRYGLRRESQSWGNLEGSCVVFRRRDRELHRVSSSMAMVDRGGGK
jgi:hypothetical protein